MLAKLLADLAVGAPSVGVPFTSPMNTLRGPAPNSAVQMASPSTAALKPLMFAGMTPADVAPPNGLPGRSPS